MHNEEDDDEKVKKVVKEFNGIFKQISIDA
jgi:hypothetical protein